MVESVPPYLALLTLNDKLPERVESVLPLLTKKKEKAVLPKTLITKAQAQSSRLEPLLATIPTYVSTVVDSPPPSPPSPPNLPHMDKMPPLPPMPEMPPVPSFEGLPDYLTEDEAKQVEAQKNLEAYEQDMHAYQVKMEKWQQKWANGVC